MKFSGTSLNMKKKTSKRRFSRGRTCASSTTPTPSHETRREPLNALGKLQRDLAEQGIATACDAFYDASKSHGLFSIHWACPDVRCEDAAYYVTANLVRLSHTVSDAEV